MPSETKSVFRRHFVWGFILLRKIRLLRLQQTAFRRQLGRTAVAKPAARKDGFAQSPVLRGNFAFETVVQIETFAAARQGFQIARTAAVVGEDACNQCGIVLRQSGNQILIDAERQRFEAFEYIVFAVDVVGDHFGLFLFAHSLDGGFQCRAQSGFLCHFGCIPLRIVRSDGTAMVGILV